MPFDWIHTCLRLEDIPGAHSFFEREVFMAARSLKRLENDKHNGLVLIDELFHSTNPSDSNRAAKLYTNKLWSSSNCISLITTHDFDLVRNAPDKIARLCCPATANDDGSINYTYTLCDGICEVSSVDEILLEKGVTSSAQRKDLQKTLRTAE
jgi:DNA mismatch repair ATPase MutS